MRFEAIKQWGRAGQSVTKAPPPSTALADDEMVWVSDIFQVNEALKTLSHSKGENRLFRSSEKLKYYTSRRREVGKTSQYSALDFLTSKGPDEQTDLNFDAEKRESKRIITRELPVNETAKVKSTIKEQWIGLVISVSPESFTARLKRKTTPIEEEAEFYFDGLEGITREEIIEGSIFDWIVGMRQVNKTEARVSSIYFRRIPLIDPSEIAHSWESGNELLSSITERD